MKMQITNENQLNTEGLNPHQEKLIRNWTRDALEMGLQVEFIKTEVKVAVLIEGKECFGSFIGGNHE